MQPARPSPLPDDAHEWVSFEDPDFHRTWLFDLTFLLSPWTCLYGNGCQGVKAEPTPELAQGCCTFGAHFGDADDRARIEAAAQTLTPETWQFHRQGQLGVVHRLRGKAARTRVVQGGCIFLNRPGFPGGPGCALHRAALERNEPPHHLKPDVCWQLPFRLLHSTGDDGHLTTRVVEWSRHDWGEGGGDLHWWCTEAPEAFVGKSPVFERLRTELVAIAGQAVYDRLVTLCRHRQLARPLPHPALSR